LPFISLHNVALRSNKYLFFPQSKFGFSDFIVYPTCFRPISLAPVWNRTVPLWSPRFPSPDFSRDYADLATQPEGMNCESI
jgi:hypothetical protein